MKSGTHFCRSFAPNIGENPEILILGSMPGGESLRRQQYYAFSKNAFWRMMAEFFEFSPEDAYEIRLEILRNHRIALWDVLSGCEREGSLDMNILHPEPNDLAGLLRDHPGICRIFCNGTAAGKYLKKFFPELFPLAQVLPSTSPAAAILRYEEKREIWRRALFA